MLINILQSVLQTLQVLVVAVFFFFYLWRNHVSCFPLLSYAMLSYAKLS